MPELTRTDARQVLVLGGQGVFGTVLGAAFETAGWTTVRAGRRPAAGRAFRHVDLDKPEALAEALDEADLVVSAIPDERLTAERMVLERGGVLINVAALPAGHVRRLRDEAGQARGTVLMNAGIAPGMTSLLAADLLASYPAADEVELVFTLSARGSIGPASGRSGRRGMTAVRQHRTTVVPLPEPFGRRRCLGFAEPDGGWLGDVVHARKVSSYICMRERSIQAALLALNFARIIDRIPSLAFAASASRRPQAEPVSRWLDSEPVTHWAAVRRGGAYLAARTLRCRGGIRAAAVITVLFAQALADRSASGLRGVLIPEDIFVLSDFLPALAEAGITVHDEISAERTGAVGTRSR